MKSVTTFIVAVSLLVLSSPAFSMPGPPIPKPTVKIEKALEVAREAHAKLVKKAGGHKRFKDMIIVSSKYRPLDEVIKKYHLDSRKFGAARKKGSHQWIILFVNPEENDVSMTYMVTQDEKCLTIQQTT